MGCPPPRTVSVDRKRRRKRIFGGPTLIGLWNIRETHESWGFPAWNTVGPPRRAAKESDPPSLISTLCRCDTGFRVIRLPFSSPRSDLPSPSGVAPGEGARRGSDSPGPATSPEPLPSSETPSGAFLAKRRQHCGPPRMIVAFVARRMTPSVFRRNLHRNIRSARRVCQWGHLRGANRALRCRRVSASTARLHPPWRASCGQSRLPRSSLYSLL